MGSPFFTRERIAENEYAFAIFDAFPVSPGHALVIPKREFADYFEATQAEQASLWNLVRDVRLLIQEKFKGTSFNIGINVGAPAGQTVMHMHIHIIPRFHGDVPDPRGGVRGVIPGKAKYQGLDL